MGIGNFFHAFQPKDRVFHVLFEKITDNLVGMAGEFKEKISHQEQVGKPFLDRMKQFEHQNDDLTHQIYVELSKNFITPFDREDIHRLASGLDDIADYIFATTECIVLYKSPRREAYTIFARIIYDACIEIKSAMKHLKGFRNVKEVEKACIKVNSLENEADSLLSRSKVELFENEDAVRIIKISSVLDNLEVVTDKAEMVANTIQSIMIKFS